MPFQLFQVIQELGLPKPRGVLQVGASYGQEMQWFVENGIQAGVFIEPLPEPFQALSRTCQQLPNFVAVNALCSEATGERVSFHVASNGGMSSSMLKPKNHLQEFDFVSFDRMKRIANVLRDSEQVRNFTMQQWQQLGKRSLFDVMAAESDHFNTRVNYVNALYDTQQLNANLLSLGRGVIEYLR